jgi:hypothetical protein
MLSTVQRKRERQVKEGGCDQPLLLPALVHSSLVAAEERFGRTVEEVSSDVTSTTTEETEEEDDEVRFWQRLFLSYSLCQVFTAEVVDPAPCKRRRLLKPLTLTPEVLSLSHLPPSLSTCSVCVGLPAVWPSPSQHEPQQQPPGGHGRAGLLPAPQPSPD